MNELKSVIVKFPSIVHENCDIGDGTTIYHFVLIRENCKIGNNVSIGTHSELGPSVVIGDNVRIHSNCFIPELTEIQNGAWLGPGVVVCNDKYPGPSGEGETKVRLGVTIMEKATIGANVTILPGVTIGYRAIVGAGSVVTKDVPDWAVVIGNPARSMCTVEGAI